MAVAEKASAMTVLAIGSAEIPIALFKAHGDPAKKLAEFDRAGPSGGVLRVEQRAMTEATASATEADVKVSDPFGVTGAPPVSAPAPASSPGMYGSVLVEEGTGEVVAPDQVRRGVRRPDGSFVDCTAQLERIEEQTRIERVRVERFVDVSKVPRAWVKCCYYVGAQDVVTHARALRMLLEAMKRTRRGALLKWTKRTRQSLGILSWHGRALALYELTFPEDFRKPPDRARAIDSVVVAEDGEDVAPGRLVLRESQIERTVCFIEEMSDRWEAGAGLRDDAIQLREELHARALFGELDEPDEPVEDEDDRLMAELAASLEAVTA